LETLPGFNRTIPLINFPESFVYIVHDPVLGRIGLLVEKMVDPHNYKKWNNNCGFVESQAPKTDVLPGMYD